MSSSFSCRGTVQTGKGRILGNWGFGRLESSPSELSVRAPLLSRLAFTPKDVVSLDSFTRIPILYWGIRIRHVRKDCPQTVRFRALRTPESLLSGIEGSGFLPQGVESDECLACGKTMPKTAAACPSCGWTFASDGANDA